MLMPKLFGRDVLDDWFFSPVIGSASKASGDVMKTDVKETPAGFDLIIDLPGVKKENVTAELKEGYLTISATTNDEKEEAADEGRYIRRERYCGKYSRTFFVGDAVTEEDIKARFENGVLLLNIPKKEKLPEIEAKKFITIE